MTPFIRLGRPVGRCQTRQPAERERAPSERQAGRTGRARLHKSSSLLGDEQASAKATLRVVLHAELDFALPEKAASPLLRLRSRPRPEFSDEASALEIEELAIEVFPDWRAVEDEPPVRLCLGNLHMRRPRSSQLQVHVGRTHRGISPRSSPVSCGHRFRTLRQTPGQLAPGERDHLSH